MNGIQTAVMKSRLLVWGLLFLIALTSIAAPASAADAPQAEAEIRELIKTIENEETRNRLLQDLKALLAVAEQKTAAEPSVGDRFLSVMSETLHQMGGRLDRAMAGLARWPEVLDWLRVQMTSPDQRAWWFALAWQIAAVLAIAFGVEYVVRRLVRAPRQAIESRDLKSYAARLPWLMMRSLLDLLPIAAFAFTAYGFLIWIDPGPLARAILMSLLVALVMVRALVAVARMILTPVAPSLRMHALSDANAAYMFIWARRLIRVTIYGFFLVEVAALAGLPPDAAAVALKLVGLVILILLISVIRQNRRAVANWIAGDDDTSLAALRRSVANIWHIIALFYVIAVYAVWAVEVVGGTSYVGRSTVLTILILIATRIVADLAARGLGRLFNVSEALRHRYPFVESRANRYLPFVQRVVQAIIAIAALLAILQAWDVNVAGWLATESGRDLLGRIVTIGVAIIVALIVWEGSSGIVNLYLERTDGEGNAVVQSQRLRTVLPLIRNILLVVVAAITTMVTLSELGIDIAPLIAGAGVLGLAIGFGAQTMVKDFITGMFIFFEDSLHVGDVATVAGRTGTVEAITVRTVMLRDLTGTVHTIPFSSVDVVENLTKDFSYAVLDVGVGYGEDVDKVIEVLQEIGEELREDANFGRRILAPLEVFGLNEFGDSAVVVRVRMKTKAASQWALKRAFNKRIKEKFDALGIEIPFPHRTIFFGGGEAPGKPDTAALAPADAPGDRA